MTAEISKTRLAALSNFIRQNLGIYFPPERRGELARKIRPISADFGFANVDACIDWLVSTPLTQHQIEILAAHLTIGETYFFREGASLETLEYHILPLLIKTRQNNSKQLRIWSAGCATGEEPYSIAILLDKLIPNLAEWDITIHATDINPHFLRRAEQGIYGEWSFRNTPDWARLKYFAKTEAGKYQVIPKIKGMVKFSQLNLAEAVYPSILKGLHTMDIVFCRNVLIYFDTESIFSVVNRLYRTLVDGGWLFVAPAEAPFVSASPFSRTAFSDTTLFRKETAIKPVNGPVLPPKIFAGTIAAKPSNSAPPTPAEPDAPDLEPASAPAPVYQNALALYRQGQYRAAITELEASLQRDKSCSRAAEERAIALLTYAHANLGQLPQAQAWCEKAIAKDKLNPLYHYLLAIVLQEEANYAQAVRSLKKTLFLDNNFTMAYFSLANLLQRQGNHAEARKYCSTLRALLETQPPETILPGSEGLSAASLKEMIAVMKNQEAKIQ